MVEKDVLSRAEVEARMAKIKAARAKEAA
jgi:hypothetical protein